MTDLDDPNCNLSQSETAGWTNGEQALLPPSLSGCEDGIDNDGDGFTDLEDSDCTAPSTGEYYLTNCNDGIDNDGDGLIDLDDPDCKLSEGGNGE